MCNACGFGCCAMDCFERCGCDHCPEPKCWSKCEGCGMPEDLCECEEEDDLTDWDESVAAETDHG